MFDRKWSALCIAVAAGLAGCAKSSVPMSASIFVSNLPTTMPAEPALASSVAGPTDRLSNEPKNAVVLSPIDPQPFSLNPQFTPAPAASPSPAIVLHSTTGPATPDNVSGVYMNIGGVLATVNDTPIYTRQVFSQIDNELKSQARFLSEREFKRYADRAINEQLMTLVVGEIDFVMAYKALSDDERREATAWAGAIRRQLVTAAGGSVALARRRAAESGIDFDEMIQDQYRGLVVHIWQRRTVDLLVHVSAEDLRDFYARNFDKLYSEPSKAKFRVIMIDPEKAGGAEASRKKAEAIRGRAVNGEDFARMAAGDNDDDFLKSNAGLPAEWMGANSYRVAAVESAVWSLDAGQVTPVIEDGGRHYVAKLEQKVDGKSRSFEEAQDDVDARLRQPQRMAELDKLRASARGDSILRVPPEAIDNALDIAMQKYAMWREGRK